jgi:hypothetical protein
MALALASLAGNQLSMALHGWHAAGAATIGISLCCGIACGEKLAAWQPWRRIGAKANGISWYQRQFAGSESAALAPSASIISTSASARCWQSFSSISIAWRGGAAAVIITALA